MAYSSSGRRCGRGSDGGRWSVIHQRRSFQAFPLAVDSVALVPDAIEPLTRLVRGTGLAGLGHHLHAHLHGDVLDGLAEGAGAADLGALEPEALDVRRTPSRPKKDLYSYMTPGRYQPCIADGPIRSFLSLSLPSMAKAK